MMPLGRVHNATPLFPSSRRKRKCLSSPSPFRWQKQKWKKKHSLAAAAAAVAAAPPSSAAITGCQKKKVLLSSSVRRKH